MLVLMQNVCKFRYKEPNSLDKLLTCIFPTDQLLKCPLGQECFPEGECYDLYVYIFKCLQVSIKTEQEILTNFSIAFYPQTCTYHV